MLYGALRHVSWRHQWREWERRLAVVDMAYAAATADVASATSRTVRAHPGRLSGLSVFNSASGLCGALYGRAWRLTAQNGGFRPGQSVQSDAGGHEQPWAVKPFSCTTVYSVRDSACKTNGEGRASDLSARG